MKNVLFILAFMLMGVFLYSNNNTPEDFPSYDHNLYLVNVDCSCQGALSSCAMDGWCSCSCGFFSCSCKPANELTPSPVEFGMSMSKEQYENTKNFALLLKSLGESDSYNLIAGIVNDLKEKNYEDLIYKREKLMVNLNSLTQSKKDSLNNFLSSINAQERI